MTQYITSVIYVDYLFGPTMVEVCVYMLTLSTDGSPINVLIVKMGFEGLETH